MNELFRGFVENPVSKGRLLELRDPRSHQAYLQYCLSVIDSSPSRGQEVARIAIRSAPGVCEAVQGWGLYAATFRMLGNLDAAEAAIRQARLMAGECLACRADLDRRYAHVKRDLKLFPAAFRYANTAIQRYELLSGQRTHDLYGNGLASSFLCRGQIYYEAGLEDLENSPSLFSRSVADISEVLSIISRKDSPRLFSKSMFNLAVALYATRRRDDLKLANEHIKTARQLFKGVQDGSPERAKLDWITAMIRYELHIMKLHRVYEYLIRAQQYFLEEGMPQEAVAVTADLARITFPDQNRIRELVEDVDGRVASMSQDLRQRIQDVLAATKIGDWSAPEIMKTAIEGLRNACGPMMLKCLITWPSSM